MECHVIYPRYSPHQQTHTLSTSLLRAYPHTYTRNPVGKMADMELDQVIFGLDSFVDACEQNTLNPDSIYTETYVTLLDRLAVLLRDEDTRDHELVRTNLEKIAGATDYVIVRSEQPGLRPVAMEALRVLANAVADKPQNRLMVVQCTQLIQDLGSQLEENFDDDDLNERVFILLKNLVIDSPDVAKTVTGLITSNLLVYTSYENAFLSIDLLTDLIKYQQYPVDIKNVERFTKKLTAFISKQEEFDEEEFPELMVNTSTILEELTMDQRLSFKDHYHETSTQESLFQCLKLLEPLEFQNKLIVQRKIFGSMGNVSANPSSSNKPMVDICLQKIKDVKEENGYIVSGAMTIVGNFIASASDRNEVLEKAPTLITNVLFKYNNLIDPVQFQGILHILKNLVSFDTIGDFFANPNVVILSQLIEATERNSRYYTNFTSLLTAFLKKLIVLLGKSQLVKLSENKIIDSLLSFESNYESNTILLLLINKVAVYGTDTDLSPLVSRVLEFKDPNVPASYIFELTKTVGVLLQNKPSYVLVNHTQGIITLLETAKTMTNSGENAAKAIQNNARYIAGTLLNLSKEMTLDEDLKVLCTEFLRG